ncbi:ABC transporter permease [Treponema lecithinolyticum]|uniref:ABC transporter, permease protein n=1 Tax=Treponema lecithinolyticum ATCC 700332 TaxID=1321815 RepID=A0ABN0NX79_TRELE|nr:ABC transporter permease subunit [Treponema lecithinolyticum]ERJ91999.1 ABC transporter, permease protein [Treponema lecithinolyticum ATCC 700332]
MTKIVQNKKESVLNKIAKDWDLYLLLLPGFVWYLLFCYKPMAGLITAFYDYNVFKGLAGSTFVGFANFSEFINGPDFVRTIKNTLMIALWQIFICFPLPIVLAIAVTEMKNRFIRKLTQTATFLPYFISVVVVCGMVINFLSPSTGIVNLIIKKLGFTPVYFMVEPKYFRLIYTMMTLWQTAGFNAIVYIAAIMGIDSQLYEAAIVDGANKWKRIVHITVPGILPTVITMFIMNIGKMVKVGYESILLLYQPTTYPVADVISTYSYRIGIENGDYGLATAAGLFEAVVALILVSVANKISKRVTENSLW